MIQMEGIHCGYGDGDVLAGIDLRVARGEAVALIGANGCGKTTLLRLVNGLVPARSGQYRFDGEPVTPGRLDRPEFARGFHQRIGFLFQKVDAQLFCPTVREEVGFGPRQMGLAEDEVGRRVADCLALMGIGHLERRVPYHLSEGEQRRVAMASVLALNPEVLVLDEPLNGLDPRMKRFMGELLAGLGAAGKTILASTHEFLGLEGVFHTAAVLGEDHRLARTGPFRTVVGDREFLESVNVL
jgi:cobalt/nickel transport system ATP-binding protein